MSIQNHQTHLLTRPQVAGIVSFVRLLLIMLQNGRILYGKQDIKQFQPPGHRYQKVYGKSSDWNLLRRAAILAYQRAREEWGEEFCRTLCHWLENTNYIFVFDALTDHKGVCTGVTFPKYPGNPVIHIALRDSNGKPRTIRQIAATLLHEIMHLRERHQHLPNYPNLHHLQQQIRKALGEYEAAGTLDPETANALYQDDEEQISWTIEGNALGTNNLEYREWKDDHPKVVHLLARHKQDIAPPQPRYRTVTITKPTHKPQELTMTKTTAALDIITTPQTQDQTKMVCGLPERDPRYPTHPISRGVLQWLKAQVQDAIRNPNRHWNGCHPEYLQLKAGTHPDPNPGKIITPDNPASFNPHILNIPEDELPRRDIGLGALEEIIKYLDAYAWEDIEILQNQIVTPERYAQKSLQGINEELETHEEELQRRQEIKQDLQDHKLDHLPEHIKQNIRNWYP